MAYVFDDIKTNKFVCEFYLPDLIKKASEYCAETGRGVRIHELGTRRLVGYVRRTRYKNVTTGKYLTRFVHISYEDLIRDDFEIRSAVNEILDRRLNSL